MARNCNYFNDNLEPKRFEVVAENDDGTIDIGTGKVAVVKSCQVVQTPTAGAAMLVEDDPAEIETKAPAKKGKSVPGS